MTTSVKGSKTEGHEKMNRPESEGLTLQTGDALVVVDVQNDFLPGGSLAVEGGDKIIAPFNRYLEAAQANEIGDVPESAG